MSLPDLQTETGMDDRGVQCALDLALLSPEAKITGLSRKGSKRKEVGEPGKVSIHAAVRTRLHSDTA